MSPLNYKKAGKQMGRVFYSFEEYDAALDQALAEAMNSPEGRVQRNAKEEITKMAETFVYDLYPVPFYLSRRGDNGGMLDPKNYNSRNSTAAHRMGGTNVSVSGNTGTGKGFTIYIAADVPWQQKFGGSAANNPDTLVDAIEKHGIYHHQPFYKSYMELAETNYGTEHRLGKDVVAELEARGL